MKKLGEQAIVIGASMGGLLAARVLSDFYTIVTVLQRDAFPALDTPRKRRTTGSPYAWSPCARQRGTREILSGI